MDRKRRLWSPVRCGLRNELKAETMGTKSTAERDMVAIRAFTLSGQRRLLYGEASQGLMTGSPAASKGVATAKPLAMAMATAAMKASAVSTARPAAWHKPLC